MVPGGTNHTGNGVLGRQGSLMHKGNEGCPVWTVPGRLLWNKLHKILMAVLGEMCHNTVQSLSFCFVLILQRCTRNTANVDNEAIIFEQLVNTNLIFCVTDTNVKSN